jgi:hypothetical protein
LYNGTSIPFVSSTSFLGNLENPSLQKTLSLGLLPPPRYNHGIFSSFFYFFLSLLPLPHFSFLSFFFLIFILLLLPSKGWG